MRRPCRSYSAVSVACLIIRGSTSGARTTPILRRSRIPLRYLKGPSRSDRLPERTLPWQDLGRGFKESGWIDLTHTRASLEIKGVRIGFRGTDDAHIDQDRYADVAGPIDRDEIDVAIGVTHAPYLRVLDAMTSDGHDLIIAGHTHGGQVCVPFYGALVTNCDLDTRRAKGLSQHSADGQTAWLNVSAGVGTSPYAPIRFACPLRQPCSP